MSMRHQVCKSGGWKAHLVWGIGMIVVTIGSVPTPGRAERPLRSLVQPADLVRVIPQVDFRSAGLGEVARLVARQGVPIGLERLVGLSLPGTPAFPEFPQVGGGINFKASQITVAALLKGMLPVERYTFQEAYGVVNLLPLASLTLGDMNPLNWPLPALTLTAGPLKAAEKTLERLLPGIFFGLEGVDPRMGLHLTTAVTLTVGSSEPYDSLIIVPVHLPTPLILPAGLTLRQVLNALVTACSLGMWQVDVRYQYGLGLLKKSRVSLIVRVWAQAGQQIGGP